MRAFIPELESFLLTYLLNSLWQVPLLFVAALGVARLARPLGPRVAHRVWVGALLAQVIVPLCRVRLNELGQQAWGLALWFRPAAPGQVHVDLGAGTTAAMNLPWPMPNLLAAVAIAYLCSLLFFIGRLAWGISNTQRMRRDAVAIEAPAAPGKLARLGRMPGAAPQSIHFAVTPALPGPAAVGIRRQTLLLPPALLETLAPEELDAVLAHELAHMARQDFLKNLLYEVVTLPIAYHPLLGRTLAQVAETRELLCDAMAAEQMGGRTCYARSLLKLAHMLSDRRAPRFLHAIGIFDANIFERRVMNLTRKPLAAGRARRYMITAACGLIVAVACTSALALRMDVKAPGADSKTPIAINVKPSEMKIVSKVPPFYPVRAKKDRIQGVVTLSAVIGKDGTVQHLEVVKSVRADLDTSAMDAVHQWRWQPYLLNGDPVEVKTTVNITYALAK